MANSPIDNGFATIDKSRLKRQFGSVGALDADSIAYDATNSIKEQIIDTISSIDNKVDKVTGKGLSTEDYTTTEKSKLASIESGAEVNTINDVIAGTNITIDKTDPLNPVISSTGGGGGTPATTVTNETSYGITPSVGVGTEYARNDHTHGTPATTKDKTAITGLLKGNGTDVSAAISGTDYAAALGDDDNYVTDSEKTKLAGIETGAEVNNISDVNATDLTDGGDTSLHSHDGMYNTKSEITTLLSGKQNTLSANQLASIGNGIMVTSGDTNAQTSGGRYGMIGTPTNGPKAGEFALEVYNDGTRVMQIATFLDNTLATRYFDGASWSSWILGTTTGTNTGDQTNISGNAVSSNISGTTLGLEAGPSGTVKLDNIFDLPTIGQVLTATSPTTAEWVTPSGGGSAQLEPLQDYQGTATIGVLGTFVFDSAKTITKMSLTSDTIPVGSNLIIELRKNSYTSGNILPSTLQIATSDTLTNGKKTVIVSLTTSNTMAAGDYVTAYITSCGSTTPALNPFSSITFS